MNESHLAHHVTAMLDDLAATAAKLIEISERVQNHAQIGWEITGCVTELPALAAKCVSLYHAIELVDGIEVAQ